jgi:hypothetical protein
VLVTVHLGTRAACGIHPQACVYDHGVYSLALHFFLHAASLRAAIFYNSHYVQYRCSERKAKPRSFGNQPIAIVICVSVSVFIAVWGFSVTLCLWTIGVDLYDH